MEALLQTLRPDEGLASHSEERDYYIFLGHWPSEDLEGEQASNEESLESSPSLALGAQGEAIPGKGQLGRTEPAGLPQEQPIWTFLGNLLFPGFGPRSLVCSVTSDPPS